VVVRSDIKDLLAGGVAADAGISRKWRWISQHVFLEGINTLFSLILSFTPPSFFSLEYQFPSFL